jgi:hypothetical protein
VEVNMKIIKEGIAVLFTIVFLALAVGIFFFADALSVALWYFIINILINILH